MATFKQREKRFNRRVSKMKATQTVLKTTPIGMAVKAAGGTQYNLTGTKVAKKKVAKKKVAKKRVKRFY